MKEHYIANPKPLFANTSEPAKNTERLIMGSGSSGIVFDITRKGLEVNGYYEGFNKRTKYANLTKPVFIPWEELNKTKERVLSSGKVDKFAPVFIDKVPDKKYLATLPTVHINNKEYYIDSIRRERRLVANPQNVYKF